MGTISSAFSLIGGALNAEQAGLSIIANNVANANTPGYTEEVPNWQENQPITIDGTSYGTGVTQTGPTSVRDRVLLERLDQQQQLASASGSRLSALDTIQTLFTPDSGSTSSEAGDIGYDMTAFYDSFSSLEANATTDATRQQVLSSAATLAGDISNAANALNSQRASLDQEASSAITQVNALLNSISQLNQQIQSTSSGSDAGVLEDQRQQDLSQLSQLIGVNQVTTGNDGLSLTTTSGQALISGQSTYPITTGMVGGVTHFFVGTTDVTAGLTSGGGALGGYLTARDEDIPGVLNSLDELAFGVSTQVNALNNAGTGYDGVQGTGTDASGTAGTGTTPRYIFAEPTQIQGSAASMKVVMTDANQISASGFGGGSGSNANAVAMSNLLDEPLLQPLATTSFSMTQNLSSATAVNGTVTGNVEVYDSLGKSYTATVTYTNQGGGTWGYQVSVADPLTADTSVPGQVSYTFGSGESVDPSTALTIDGVTIPQPPTGGEPLGSAGPPATGYVNTIETALAGAGITGVTVSVSGNTLTIAGAATVSGPVVASAAAANATGTLQFDSSGNLVSPVSNVNDISFSGFTDGALGMNLTWELYGDTGQGNVTQTTGASAQTGESQNGYNLAVNQSPVDFFSNLVTVLGSTVSQVQTENTAQSASVSQLQNQNDALSSVNLNSEATAMQQLERSYQAASQVFTILNNIMTSVLNLGVETAVS